ncbi:MAG: hypothetical protein AB7H86_18945 [Blastocatellales bacterium]
MQFSHRLSALISTCILLITCASSAGAQSGGRAAPAGPKRISFTEAVTMLDGESEGNLSNQPRRYSKTKLRDGRVLETFYPLTTRSGKSRRITVAGYGVLYESEDALRDSNRPRHMLEDLIPDGNEIVNNLPQLIDRLEKRLRLGKGRLDFSRASLRRIDAWLAGYQRSRTTAQTDPRLFQELTAYYGETIRRALNGQWRIHNEPVGKTHVQTEPNIRYSGGGVSREIKPWSSVINALYDEDNRGIGLTRVLDKDLEGSRQ